MNFERIYNDTNGVMLFLRYRLAPEHQFPIAVEDCIELTKWVFDNCDKLGIDRNKIQLVGDSAGGNLVLNVALELLKNVSIA